MVKLKSTDRGITLLEVMLGGTLLAALVFFAFSLLNNGNRFFKKSFDKATLHNSLATLTGFLQKSIASGDIRFYGFTTADPTRLTARFLIPQPGQCADLSNCPESVSLLYVNYDKSTTPAVSGICFSSNGTSSATLVIDTHNTTYGTATANSASSPTGFQIASAGSMPSGVVSLNANLILALQAPPNANLWISSGNLKKITINYTAAAGANPATYVDAATGLAWPSECSSQLSAPGVVDGLYSIDIKPLMLTQFTGGGIPTQTQITQMLPGSTSFPIKVFSATLRSTGLIKNAQGTSFTLLNCTVNASSAISCPSLTPSIAIAGMTKLQIFEFFKIAFSGESSTLQNYEIVSGTSDGMGCLGPTCRLGILANTAIPVTFNNETAIALDPTQFSLFKQESLSRIRLQLTLSDQTMETADVIFP